MNWTKQKITDLTYRVNGACINVHKHLGPGLLESVYHKFLKIEFNHLGIKYVSEQALNLEYRGENVELEFRCDFLIEGILILEIKSVKEIIPVFEAQILTYMKISECPKGILMNFNVVNLSHEGYKPFVNELYKNLPD